MYKILSGTPNQVEQQLIELQKSYWIEVLKMSGENKVNILIQIIKK